MATIYLSATYEGLKAYCRVVFEALRKSRQPFLPMKDYIATDQRPVNKCVRNVEKSDLYVGLFVFRYGSVPSADQGNSNG